MTKILELLLSNQENSLKSSYWKSAWNHFWKTPSSCIGSFLLIIIFTMAILGPYLNPFSYQEIHLSIKNQSPNLTFWFGTDELGRDVFTRIWQGARISLFVAIAAVIIDLIIGVFWGAIAAFFGGILDEILMRICDVLSSIPYLLMVILLMVVTGPGFLTIIIALACTGWINMARITRAKVLEIKQLDFIHAAIALGATKKRIIFKHIIPNAIGPIIATMTLTIPTAIFAEAFLSFLGLGIQAPYASWGMMASDGLNALRYYPWRLFFPGIMISITILSFNLIADGLRDSLDPRLRS